MTRLSKKRLRCHFARAAHNYQQVAVVQHEMSQRLLSRLDYMKIKPQRILDCGAQHGYSTHLLRTRFPQAQVIGLDMSHALLQQLPRRWYQRRQPAVCSDYHQLPFVDRSFDMVFANLALHWASDLAAVLQEFYRVLRPNGLLLFTTLGPDTLKELRASCFESAWSAVHDFIDMHDIGDQLLQACFQDPVMDMEYFYVHYHSVKQLLQDLKANGATNARIDAPLGLGGQQRLADLCTRYQTQWQQGNIIPATLEIIYGQAWLPLQPDLATMDERGEVRVSLHSLRQKISGYDE